MKIPRFLSSRRFWIGAATALLLSALAAIPLWRWAFARVSSDGRLESWINRRPDKVSVSWESLRSPWPGWFEAAGVRVVGHTRRFDWQLRAGRVTGSLQIPALLARQVRLVGLRGNGVDFEVHRREGEADTTTSPGAEAEPPPHPASAAPSGDSPVGPPQRKPGRHPWNFYFLDLALDGVRHLDLDGRLLSGEIAASGSLVLRDRKTAEIESATIRLANTRVAAGEKVLARVESGRAEFDLSAWPYRGAGPEVLLPRFSGTVELRGELAPSELASYLFGRASWLELEGDDATVDARVEIDRGSLEPGTRIHVTSPGERVRIFGFEARGNAEMVAEVEAQLGTPSLAAELTLASWEMGRAGAEPIAHGEGLRLAVRREQPRLDRSLTDATVTLDLGTSTADDLGFVNDYLPPATRLRIDHGSGTLTGRIEIETRERSGSGELAIRADDLALSYGDDRLSGTVKVDLVLSAPELERRTFSIAGSRIRVDSFRLGSESGTTPGWWGAIELPAGRLDLSLPLTAEAEFRAHLADTSPIVALYDARRDIPKWAERLLTLELINVFGRASVAPGTVRLDDVLVPLPRGELRARLRLERDLRSGKLLLSGRSLALGIGIEGKERQLKIRNARDWYAEGSGAKPD